MTVNNHSVDGEVIGETVQVCIDGVMSVFQSRMRNMLDEEGIEQPDPRPGEWYPLSEFLAVLDAVETNTGENALTKIGESTPRFADWPSGYDDPAAAMERLTEAYEANHRNVTGEYEFEQTGETDARVTSTTPYPVAWEEGMLKGTAQLSGSEYARVTTERRADGKVVFEISWR